MMHWTSLYRAPPGASQRHGTPTLLLTSGDHHWKLEDPPIPYRYLHLVAAEAYTGCKRAVPILLEDFLVVASVQYHINRVYTFENYTVIF